MAKLELASYLRGISGKVESEDDLVCRMRNGRPHMYKMDNSNRVWSDKQKGDRALFGAINAKVSEDMRDEKRKAHWEKVAKASRGKVKSARSAAWAYWKGELGKG